MRAGAHWVNDVSALRDDPAMAEVVAASGATVVLMHRLGTPLTMQLGGGPFYGDVISQICEFLQQRMETAVAGGIDRSRIILDPGIGFGKRVEDNLRILRHFDKFLALGQPVLLGVSRKSFLGQVLGTKNPRERDAASIACAAMATLTSLRIGKGPVILRVHDVAGTVDAVRLCRALCQLSDPPQPERQAAAP